MRITTLASLTILGIALAGCTPTPDSPEEIAAQHTEVMKTITSARQTDPGLEKFFDTSVGYAVLPDIAKGAAGVGAAYGTGEVFQNGVVIGFCDVTQGSVGVQLGGQTYSEIIFFQTESALIDFKSGDFALAAQVSAVAVKAGASASADYQNGVAVFTLGEGGLMYEASVGGQEFDYEDK